MDIKTADRLQALRKSHGLSQEALSEKLGVSRQAVSKWERGESSPDTDNLIALAGIYNITLDDILNTDKELSTVKSVEENVTQADKEDTVPVKKQGVKEPLGKALLKFPFALVVAAVYVVLNLLVSKWHPSWLMFFALPIYYHFAGACFAKTQKGFLLSQPVPELAAAVYLVLGFWQGLWAAGAAVFIAIPIYYWAVAFYKKK